MRTRLEFREELLSKVGSDFKLYFQPPDNTKIEYPCIIYKFANEQIRYANDIKYKGMKQYTITVIDEDPDSEIPDKIETIPYSSFDRFYVSDGLNHFVYTIFY